MRASIRVPHEPMSIALAASGWVAIAASWLPAGSLVRSWVLAAFLLWCPGAAIMRLWPATDWLERTVLTVAMSVSISVLITELQLFSGAWWPRASVAALAVLTTVLVLITERRTPIRKPNS